MYKTARLVITVRLQIIIYFPFFRFEFAQWNNDGIHKKSHDARTYLRYFPMCRMFSDQRIHDK